MTNYEVAKNGILIASTKLEIETPKIDFYINDCLDTKGINSMFLKEEYKIIFSQDWIEKADWLEVMVVCFHETRHAFQYKVATGNYKGKETIDQLLVDKWLVEINEYKQPSGVIENDEYYLNQEIEIDAVSFAHYQMSELFKVKTIIPLCIKVEVNKRINCWN